MVPFTATHHPVSVPPSGVHCGLRASSVSHYSRLCKVAIVSLCSTHVSRQVVLSQLPLRSTSCYSSAIPPYVWSCFNSLVLLIYVGKGGGVEFLPLKCLKLAYKLWIKLCSAILCPSQSGDDLSNAFITALTSASLGAFLRYL